MWINLISVFSLRTTQIVLPNARDSQLLKVFQGVFYAIPFQWGLKSIYFSVKWLTSLDLLPYTSFFCLILVKFL